MSIARAAPFLLHLFPQNRKLEQRLQLAQDSEYSRVTHPKAKQHFRRVNVLEGGPPVVQEELSDTLINSAMANIENEEENAKED